MSNTLIEIELEHAWRYFELHANQRISVFNFYLILSGSVAAGLATTIQGSQRFSSLGILLGILLMLVAFVFWKLDQRVSFLIKHAEVAISEIEQKLSIKSVRLFQLEPAKTSSEVSAPNMWYRHWTYGKSFRFMFAIMGGFGFSGSILSAFKFFGVIAW